MSLPRSRASSQSSTYSIDLNALPGIKSEYTVSEIPQPHYDSVRTEDINGPSDFTQNMDYWMRASGDYAAGNNPGRGNPDADGESLLRQTRSEHDAVEDINGALELDDTLADANDSQHEDDHVKDMDRLSVSSLSLDEQQGTFLSSPQRPEYSADYGTQTRPDSMTHRFQPTVEDHEDTPLPQQPPPTPARRVSSKSGPQPGDDSKPQSNPIANPESGKVAELERNLAKTQAELDRAREASRAGIENAQFVHEHDLKQIKASAASEINALRKRVTEMQSITETRAEQNERERDAAQTAYRAEMARLESHASAKINALEAKVLDMQKQIAQRDLEQDRQHANANGSRQQRQEPNSSPSLVRQGDQNQNAAKQERSHTVEKAASDAQIAALEARLSSLQRSLEQSQSEAQKALEVVRASHQATLDLERAQSARAVANHGKELAQLQATIRNERHQHEERLAEETAKLIEALMERDAARKEAAEAKEEAVTLRRSMETELECARHRITVLEGDIEDLKDQRADAAHRQSTLQADLWAAQNSTHDLATNLAEARRSWTEAEEEANALRAELASARAELQTREEQPAQPAETYEQAQASAARIAQLEAEIAEAKAASQTRLDEMRRRAETAVTRAGTLLSREKELVEASTAARDVALVEAERLRAEVARQTSTADSASAEAAELREKLKTAEARLMEVEEQVAKLKTEMDVMRDDYEFVNSEVDQRVVDMMKRREAEWRQKLRRTEKAEAERKELGRALLRTWGSEECGPGIPQTYCYKFVKG